MSISTNPNPDSSPLTLTLDPLRSDTPEFQQRLASIVQLEAKRKTSNSINDNGEDQLARRQRSLMDALSQKGNLMTQVCNEVKDTQSHQRLLRKMMAQDTESRKVLQVNNRTDADRVQLQLKREHEAKMKQLEAEIGVKEKAVQTLLETNRKLMGQGGSKAHPSQDLRHNIALIEKETQMVSKSYEDKVNALRHEKALEERRMKAERDGQAEELAKYVQQCENDSKERQAIRTILEVLHCMCTSYCVAAT